MISDEYVAGFFDGEGCVNFSVRGKSRQIFFRVMLTNTDPDILEEFKSKYGGNLAKPRQLKENWKIFRQLTITGPMAYSFLEKIYPYAKIKKQQIKLALEFQELRNLPRKQRYTYLHDPKPRMKSRIISIIRPEIRNKELEFCAKMKELNKKGVK